MDNEVTALCFLGLSFTITKALNYLDKSKKKEHLSERDIEKQRNFKLLENNDLDAIKQLIEKEVFF